MGGVFGAYIERKTNMLKANLSTPNIKKKTKPKLPVSHLHDCKTCSFDFVSAVRL